METMFYSVMCSFFAKNDKLHLIRLQKKKKELSYEIKKMLRKVLVFTLSAGMTVSMLSGMTLGTIIGTGFEQKDVYADWSLEEEYNTDWYNSNSSEYHIDSAIELAGLAYIVNSGTDDFAYKTVYLDDNIDLGEQQWTPIGNQNNSFSGTFDGQGYEISNMVIDDTGTGDGTGLFGYVNYQEECIATIKNVGVINCDINANCNGGAIAGVVYNSCVYNCYAIGKIVGAGNYTYSYLIHNTGSWYRLTDFTTLDTYT